MYLTLFTLLKYLGILEKVKRTWAYVRLFPHSAASREREAGFAAGVQSSVELRVWPEQGGHAVNKSTVAFCSM